MRRAGSPTDAAVLSIGHGNAGTPSIIRRADPCRRPQALMLNRRSFIGGAAAFGAALLACARNAQVRSATAPDRAASRRRFLVLGGTQYVGAAVVEDALRRGHEITLFN